MKESLDEFLSKQKQEIESILNTKETGSEARVAEDLSDDLFGDNEASASHELKLPTVEKITERGREEPPPQGSTRHSITKCACEMCQARRRQLAVQFGLLSDGESNEKEVQEEITFTKEICGKLMTLPHTSRYIQLSLIDKEKAELWKVSEETERTLGEGLERLLKKYLRRADFQYKQELILLLYWSTDIGLRYVSEKKIDALKKRIEELEQKGE